MSTKRCMIHSMMALVSGYFLFLIHFTLIRVSEQGLELHPQLLDFSNRTFTENVTPRNKSKGWSHINFPDPKVDLKDCGRKGKVSWICDPENILEYEEANELDVLLEDLAKYAGCVCPICLDSYGFRIAIAIVNRIDNSSLIMRHFNSTRVEVTYRTVAFAKFLRETSWSHGHCNEDVIIFISTLDRRVYIETGDKVERDWLSRSCVRDIYLNSRDDLSKGKYFKGLKNIISEFRAILKGDQNCKIESSELVSQSFKDGWTDWYLIPVIGGCIMVLLVAIHYSTQINFWYSRNRSMAIMKQHEEEMNTLSQIPSLASLTGNKTNVVE